MTPELWKPVVDYEMLYQVSDYGRVRALFDACRGRHKSGRILKPKTTPTGYLMVSLWRKGDPVRYRTLQKIVLGAFVGPRPEGKEARHLDGNRTNNALSNLKWGTNEENVQDKINHGTVPQGESHSNSKLTSDEVIQIRYLWDNSCSARMIGQLYGIGAMQACRVGRRERWGHLPEA